MLLGGGRAYMDQIERDQATKELQVLLKDILEIVIDILDTNEIEYYLVNGTLLGAVRHKGFIPGTTILI